MANPVVGRSSQKTSASKQATVLQLNINLRLPPDYRIQTTLIRASTTVSARPTNGYECLDIPPPLLRRLFPPLICLCLFRHFAITPSIPRVRAIYDVLSLTRALHQSHTVVVSHVERAGERNHSRRKSEPVDSSLDLFHPAEESVFWALGAEPLVGRGGMGWAAGEREGRCKALGY